MRRLASVVASLLAVCALAAGEGMAAEPAVPPASATPAAVGPAGQRLYARHCLSCHQADGYGVPNLQPAITGGSWVKGEAQPLALFVLTGGFNSAERKESDSHNVMPAFRQLGDEDLAAILTYIREKFGDGASPVTAAEVAAARATLPAP